MWPISALSRTDAPATSRRMSRPEAGLATTPTVTGPVIGRRSGLRPAEEVGDQAVHRTRRLHLHRVALAVDDLDASAVWQIIGVGCGHDLVITAPDGEDGNV